MDFKAISAVVADDFDAVNRFITHHLDSNVPMIREVGEYIVGNGGKRLRPLVAILSARASGYTGERHIDIAAVIEFLHTATLLHDDVVDESSMRRGRPTVNAVWGNAASVLVGDFLISRAFELLVQIGNQTLLEILSASTNVISEGEVLQLINCRDPDTTEERYMRVIHHKTAKMFESAAQTGAVLATDNARDARRAQEIFGAYGRHMGIAFQLIDDVLDYSADAAEIGKNIGDDLAEGKPTLPLIYVLRKGAPEQVAVVRKAIEHGGRDDIESVRQAIESVGGIAYTAQSARAAADQALQALQGIPTSPYKDALYGLAEFSVNRTF